MIRRPTAGSQRFWLHGLVSRRYRQLNDSNTFAGNRDQGTSVQRIPETIQHLDEVPNDGVNSKVGSPELNHARTRSMGRMQQRSEVQIAGEYHKALSPSPLHDDAIRSVERAYLRPMPGLNSQRLKLCDEPQAEVHVDKDLHADSRRTSSS